MAEKEYIERGAALNVCEMHYQHCLMVYDYCGDATADNIKTDIETIPAADVVEVVRCKDCKHYRYEQILNLHECDVFCGAYGKGYPTKPDDFCSYGERETE